MATPDYRIMAKQLELLAVEDRGFMPVLSNCSALLWEHLEDINWAGFYLVRGDILVLGPFQGKVACIHIEKGKGVCGTAWESGETQLVPDVHEFPGHIACDSASNSEIVVPVRKDGKTVAVIDIDSPSFGRFSEDDAEGLQLIAEILGSEVDWN
ncbi:MAG: GAF domain-containing protein [Oscillospiraceae bacterium]|nr:GAF domain-containing protein [Oscillospiraceae bacterium]